MSFWSQKWVVCKYHNLRSTKPTFVVLPFFCRMNHCEIPNIGVILNACTSRLIPKKTFHIMMCNFDFLWGKKNTLSRVPY